MSKDHSSRTKLAKLADALIEDILAMPKAEILAETDKADIDRARSIFVIVAREISKQQLTKAKVDFEAWKSIQTKTRTSLDAASIKILFEKIRAGDAEFNRKVMLAARNGENPSDADIAALIDDYFDLQRLDKEDEH